MGDRLWTGKPSRYVTSQLGRLSLLPSVGWYEYQLSGWVIIINGDGGCRFWQPVQADLQPKSSGLVLGRRPLGAVPHSSNEPGEFSHRLCHKHCLGCYYYYIITHFMDYLVFIAWQSGRRLIFDWRTFPVLRLTYNWRVTTYVGKASAMDQPTRPTQPFLLLGSIDE